MTCRIASNWKGTFEEMRRLFTAPVTGNTSNVRLLPKCSPDMEVGAKWYGGVSNMSELDSVLSLGWPDGLAKYKTLRRNVDSIEIPESMNRRRRMRWCDDGDYLDEDRAMIGDPMAWRGAKRKMSVGVSVIDIMFKWGGSHHQTGESLFWSGAAAIALSDVLEGQGYATSITAVGILGSRDTDELHVIKVALKNPEEPLRIDTTIAMAAHVGVFRTYGFRAVLEASFHTTESFGRNIQLDDKHFISQDPDVSKDLVFIDARYSSVGAQETLKAAVKQLTGQLVRE